MHDGIRKNLMYSPDLVLYVKQDLQNKLVWSATDKTL